MQKYRMARISKQRVAAFAAAALGELLENADTYDKYLLAVTRPLAERGTTTPVR